jgi:hypothetical protein
MGITRFDDTWWPRGYVTFCAHEERNLLREELQIGPILKKLPTFAQQS